jgi:PBP1b-binding outer membrane lipoprotein LpoB
MKRYLAVLLAALFMVGCSVKNEQKDVLAKINDYEIKAQEFEEAFKDSASAWQDNLESRKAFLESLINQKLILQEAQKTGLDKEQGFLKAIERFWEQSLLKIVLEKKTKEIANSLKTTDTEVKEAYDKLSDTEKAGKSYQDLYNQLKWQLSNGKEAKAIESWLAALRQKAAITVDYGLLKDKK